MPVAVETFTARYGDDDVTIIKGEWAQPRHDLVRRYPNKFRADSSAHRVARRGGVSAPPSRRARGVPERRFLARCTIGITQDARDEIGIWVGDGLEAGGILLGRTFPDGSIAVTDASGHGEGALRTSRSIATTSTTTPGSPRGAHTPAPR
jgi:hypothetical protein